ncbi:MAG: hypothetical protein CR967_00140 [Proteobacteria bacterium]|nr:MAG: hypothetical protein CR967_00140 [Pseudomonadota bacterium]
MYKNLILILALSFVGCSFKPPMPQVNGEFTYSIEASNINQKWWENFHDESLNSLITQALKNNSNLALASLNVQGARERLSLVDKDFLPSLSISANAKRGQSSREVPPFVKNTSSNLSLTAILNYEIDLWGRVKNKSNSAKSLYKASKYDYDGARLGLASSVAKAYFLLIAQKMEKAILEKTIKTYKNTMNYQKKQLDFGEISKLSYLQSVGEYQNAKVRLISIKNNLDLAQSALALLVGKDFDDILHKNFKTSKMLPRPPKVPSGISADVLLNRPDIASSYEKIKSSNYLIGVAKSAHLPTLSLTAAFGYQSDDLGNILRSSANIWNLAGQFAGKLFDFGRISKNVDIAKLGQDMEVKRYEIAVKTALNEVRNALNSYKNINQKNKNINSLLNSQEKIYKLSQTMFKEGEISQLQLLDAQRILLNVKLQNIEAKLGMINSIVDIYKAFGGGFSLDHKK